MFFIALGFAFAISDMKIGLDNISIRMKNMVKKKILIAAIFMIWTLFFSC